MYGIHFARRFGTRALASANYQAIPKRGFSVPMIRKENNSIEGSLKLHNLAFSWDHFLFDSLAGEAESGDDEILSSAKSLEKTDNGVVTKR